MRTVEKTFIQLCNEVDDWREEAEYWKTKYQQEVQERNAEWKERSDETMKGVGNALMFMLAVKDDENGNMVIDAESRKQLADSWM
jgi:hypothetical protein